MGDTDLRIVGRGASPPHDGFRIYPIEVRQAVKAIKRANAFEINRLSADHRILLALALRIVAENEHLEAQCESTPDD